MKKLLLISFTIGAFNLAVNAQSDEQRPAPSNTPVVKESKIKQKLQKEQDFNDAINAVNINADQQATLRDLFKSSEQELRDLKANNALTPEQKAAFEQKQQILLNEIKNNMDQE